MKMNFRKSRNRSKRNSINVMVNSEKWRCYGKRISKKGNEIFQNDSDDDEPKYNEIKDWVQEFFERKTTNLNLTDQDVEVQLTRKQTLILSTLVPDELLLLDKFSSNEPKKFVGVLLMADVSGYTSLTERYNNTGKGGTYRLTVTLNTYLGSLVELVYSHGGDILKFAGDAFLALWKTDKRTFLCHTIHTAIACALIIQHSYSSYETDVKVNLRVKLAISAGNLIFAPIGSGIDMNYVVFGLPVIEAKAAESVCASGEIKLTANAWGHCYSRNYDHVVNEDGHVTIKAILYDPHDADVNKPFLGFGAMIKQVKRFNGIECLPNILWDSPKNLSAADSLKKSEALSLRKNILLAEEKNIGTEIRKFMIRPVLTQIDAHQPLEYLTEMRQVSILFVTLKPRQSAFGQLITIVNNAYKITCEIVYKSMGCVNKIILFDKDVMILVAFGLRGFKHESEAQAALKCAYTIKKSVSNLDGVLEISVGVTTGQVYCGVVGHPLRREFTVIGAIVNKAARLMCAFRNKITCDETTFLKSKLSSNNFTLQPKTELKGIVESGKIYEYTEDIRPKELFNIPMIPPLLGQIDEMDYYQCWLNDSKKPFRDFDALLLAGESGIGKTRLLKWMARYAENENFQVSNISLSSIHSATPYLALSQIFNQLLNLQEPLSGFIKEERIVQLLKVYDEDLCYLNNILKVRFAYHERIYAQNEKTRKDKAKNVFSKLVAAIPNEHVIFIDDLQNLDTFSWEFIVLIFSSMSIFTVMSVTRGKFSSVDNWLYSVFINNSVRKIILGPIAPSLIPALACQILDVKAVPRDLCDALISKCNGMPGLVESFIIHLFSNGALELKKIGENDIENWCEEDLQFPDSSLLHPQALDAKNQKTLDELIESNQTEEIEICIVTCKQELNTNLNVQNLDALIMIQIDSLTPYQQLLLKISSVIGNVFSRELLENIMYENNWLTTAKAVKRLFAMRILICANANHFQWCRKSASNSTLNTSFSHMDEYLSCDCIFDYDPENIENLPKYAFCKVMKFKNKNSRNTCYELLPINQKKEFHSRIVSYLENNTQKCPSCGGTVMILQSVCEFPQQDSTSSIASSSYNKKSSNNSDEESITSEIEETYLKIRSRSYDSQGSRKVLDIKKSNSENGYAFKNVSTSSYNETQYASILKSKNMEDKAFGSRQSTKRVTMPNLLRKSSSDIETYKVFDKLREVATAERLIDWHALGVKDSLDNLSDKIEKQMSFTINIEKGVSQTDFNKCSCADLHVAIYDQLIYHALQADMKSKAIHFTIMYSYLNLLGNNFIVIFPKLEEAECLCYENIESLDIYNRKRFLAKIYSIRAATCLLTGKLTAAKMEMDKALKIYKINLDKVKIIQIKNILNYVKMRREKYRNYVMDMKADSVFCLNIAILLNSALSEERSARLAANKALQIIQEAQCSLVDTCDAYSNAIQVELNRGTPEATEDIERMAYQSLKQMSQPAKADELFAVGKLFMETFKARTARAQLAAAIRSGFRALTVSRFLLADNVSLDIIPDLFYILLSRRRIEEAIDVMQLTLRLNQNQVAYTSETWYYALCIDLILDAGFQRESPHDISRFAELSISKDKTFGASRRRLIVGLWTYWLRAGVEKRAKRFESEALSWSSSEENDGTLTTMISAMRLADGMLESLARKVDDLRKVVDLLELRSVADRELAKLERDACLMRTLYPRWMLLKANALKLSGRHAVATNLINQALEEASRIHNRLEEELCRAALSNSVFWAQSARRNTFIDWKPGVEHAQTSWHQLMYRITISRQ